MNTPTPRAASAALYRAVWRWHFIAGLLVLPFVLVLALTGAVYLFKDEINDAAYRPLRVVEAQGERLAPSRLVAAALEARPGEVAAYTPPAAPDRSAEVDVRGADGLKTTVYVDPYTAVVLGTRWESGAA